MFTADGQPVLRLVIDVQATNAILILTSSNLGMAAGGPSILKMVLTPNEEILFSTGDLVAFHYLLNMPFSWHHQFTFPRCMRRSAVGSKRPWVCVAACVSPMGFSAATGIMQSWHHRFVLDPS